MVRPFRSYVVAALLSAVAPGLGHLHAGRVVPGLAFAVGNVVFTALGSTLIAAGARSASLLVLVGTCSLVLWILALVGSVVGPHRAPPEGFGRWYVYLLVAALSVTGALNLALTVRRNVVQVFRIPSASMIPTIRPRARVLANEMVYQTGPVHRGDIVVFINPNQRYQQYIKRVVALPGDTVELRDGDLILNGTPLPHIPAAGVPEPWAAMNVVVERNGDTEYRIALPAGGQGKSTPPLQVPNGYCYVLGDNRARSVDSRDVGPIPLADLVGRVDWVF